VLEQGGFGRKAGAETAKQWVMERRVHTDILGFINHKDTFIEEIDVPCLFMGRSVHRKHSSP